MSENAVGAVDGEIQNSAGGLREKLAEARRIAQPREHSPVPADRPYRAVSIFASLALARLRIAPNAITIAWGVIGIAGVAALGWPDHRMQVVGAVLLEFSYLLDFVDGEVARLLGRTSQTGFFIDLVCHGLIKSSLFLMVGLGIFVEDGRRSVLVLAFFAAVALSVGYALPFLAQAAFAKRHSTAPAQNLPKSALRRWLSIFRYAFESPGIYALVLVGALAGRLGWVLLFYGIFAPLWLLREAMLAGAE